MDITAWTTYFIALAALTAAPGPVMALVVARSASGDRRGALAFAGGLCLGDVLGVCAVALGIGVWAETQPEWFAIVKYLGIAYLLWLAVGIWNARPETSGSGRGGPTASAAAGVAICLGNPSTLLIYMLLLPNVAPQGITSVEHFGVLVTLTFAAVGLVFFGTVLLGAQLSRMLAAPSSALLVSRGTAVVIGVTSLWMIAA